MDPDDLVNKAKDLLGNVTDEQIEGAAEAAKDKAPDQADSVIDTIADFLQGQNDT
jgi:hypothetical protein